MLTLSCARKTKQTAGYTHSFCEVSDVISVEQRGDPIMETFVLMEVLLLILFITQDRAYSSTCEYYS